MDRETIYSESDLLPISALQHLAFCERQWGLIHLEGYWAENRLTVEGRHLHEKADSHKNESRGDIRIARSLPLRNMRLGLVGRADVVEFHRVATASPTTAADPPVCDVGNVAGDVPAGDVPKPDDAQDAGDPHTTRPVLVPRGDTRSTDPETWRPYPVEYKRGRAKRGDCDRVQLCAQALCLEEMLAVEVPTGALYYGTSRRREKVAFDPGLRAETERLAARMHELFREGKTPIARYASRRCDRCSLIDRCIPKTTGSPKSVAEYISLALWSEHDPL